MKIFWFIPAVIISWIKVASCNDSHPDYIALIALGTIAGGIGAILGSFLRQIIIPDPDSISVIGGSVGDIFFGRIMFRFGPQLIGLSPSFIIPFIMLTS